eukprot:TRINITY_DN1349_c0_g1_i4.p1 TRINITY_DN1349_c0_g1~~TRINITY_DN1349_c0_g1_i4.p1  ORF type:complete len:595 (+),score=104.25 TRINITY_DN1349_c0_g1_i4:79-1785(+)
MAAAAAPPPAASGSSKPQFVVFANPGSGERAAFDALHHALESKLQGRIVNLVARRGIDNPADHGPKAAARIVRRLGLTGDDVVIVAGGDGTVSWGMNIVEEAMTIREGARVKLIRHADTEGGDRIEAGEEGVIATVGDNHLVCDFRDRRVTVHPGNVEAQRDPDTFKCTPFVAVIPLGTGNDLSRDLGFGPGFAVPKPCCGPPGDFAADLLKTIHDAKQSVLDRWSLEAWCWAESPVVHKVLCTDSAGFSVGPTVAKGIVVTAVEPGGPAEQAGITVGARVARVGTVSNPSVAQVDAAVHGSAGKHLEVEVAKLEPINLGHSTICNNYISIGFDAAIAERFDTFRRQYPRWCRTRIANKIWYAILGGAAMVGSPRISTRVQMTYRKTPEADLEELDLSKLSLRTLVFTNLGSYASGMSPWSSKPGRMHDGTEAHAQRSYDGRIEVCGFRSTTHMGTTQIKLTNSIRLCQAHDVFVDVAPHNDPINGASGLRMQVDGEPLRLPRTGGRVRISFKKSCRCLVVNDKSVAPQAQVRGECREAVPAGTGRAEMTTPLLSDYAGAGLSVQEAS